jgi:hypothetical protein
MSTWPVLACVAGILLTYVFRVLFARWYYDDGVAAQNGNEERRGETSGP